MNNQKSKIKNQKLEDPAALLREGAGRMGLSLPDAACGLLARYLTELLKWNQRMNLVAAAPIPEMVERHFLDSLTLLPLLAEEPPAEILDIGSGAGFPGLVLKTVYPQPPMILVEPRQKRASFLRHVIRTLHLDSIEVLSARVGENGEPGRTLRPAGYSFITSRALTDLGSFLALAAPLCAPGGRVVCMKGSKGREEIRSWQELQDPLFALAAQHEWQLPFSGASRLVAVFRRSV